MPVAKAAELLLWGSRRAVLGTAALRPCTCLCKKAEYGTGQKQQAWKSQTAHAWALGMRSPSLAAGQHRLTIYTCWQIHPNTTSCVFSRIKLNSSDYHTKLVEYGVNIQIAILKSKERKPTQEIRDVRVHVLCSVWLCDCMRIGSGYRQTEKDLLDWL